jgi:hypothetical protein
MSLKTELSYDELIERARAYGQELQAYPAKKDVEPDDDDGWVVAPPAEHRRDDFVLALEFVKQSNSVESQRSLNERIPGLYPNVPESLGLPRLTYADDDIFSCLDPDELLNVWQEFLKDCTYYRPDVLIVIVADAVNGHLNAVFNDLTGEIFSSSGVLYRRFDGSEGSVLSKLKKSLKQVA